MENDIKRKRPQTPETKEKISNSQRLRFAKYKRALKENELGRLGQKDEVDLDSLEGNEKLLELRLKLQDEFQLLLNLMFNFFKHQIRMDRKNTKEQKVNDDFVSSVIDETIKKYFEENILNDENN